MQQGQGWVMPFLLGLCYAWPKAVACPGPWGAVAFLPVPGNMLLMGSAGGKGHEQTVIPF